MRSLTSIFCAILVLFSFSQAQAKIIHVPDDSSTIQRGIDGTFSRESVISPETTEPCDVECPPEGIPEQEPVCEDEWEDIWNSGCGGDPIVFESINCNTKICGTSGTFLVDGFPNGRDTDWFRVELTEAATITWSVVAEFPVLTIIIDAGSENCEDYEILDWRQVDPCDTATLSLSVPAGVYWLWVSLSVFEGYPCGVEYVAKIKCGTCGDCNGDGVIDLGDVLYLISYLYKGGPAPDPLEAGDADNNGVVDLGDVLYLISYLYKGGPAPGPAPIGILLDYFGCKEFQKGTPMDGTPPDQDCIEYQYDGTGVLLLKHINAGFNCCPDDILADITIEDNIITIEEDESLESGGCPCLCLFDVYYRISNLPPGEYTIRINGLYLEEGDEILQFTVDLASSPSGIFCVYRDHYPWGIW